MWKYRSPHDARPAAAADQIAALIATGRADLGILAVTRVASDQTAAAPAPDPQQFCR